MRSRLSLFIFEICVLILMISVQGQESDEQMSDPYAMKSLPRDQHIPESLSASHHHIYPHKDQTRHSNRESVSSSSKFHHRYSKKRSNHDVLMRPEETAGTDFSSLTALHEGSAQNGDMESNIFGSRVPQSVKARRHNRGYRKRKSASSSAFRRRISPDSTPLDELHLRGTDFKSTESQVQSRNFGEFPGRNQQSDFPDALRSPEDQSFEPESDFDTQEFSYQSDSSLPAGSLGSESHSEDHSSGEERFYGNLNHRQHSQTASTLSNQQEQQQPIHRYLQHRNPQFQAYDSLQRHQNMLLRRRTPDHAVIVGGDAFSEHESSLRSKSFENKQSEEVPEMEASESDRLDSFPSNRRMEQHFFEDPQRLLREEEDNEWHQQRYESDSSMSEGESEDQNQQVEDENTSLDVCSEDRHTFYNDQISSSSPLYEIEPFLPPNFNEIFRRELLQKFRPYEHPSVGDDDSICNPNHKSDDTYLTNSRAMCPFEWEVSSYNSSRYPPYLMTARCTCQLAKPMFNEWSACKVKKGRIPVLWRVGCSNGKHVYREGWDEINVACIPEGYTHSQGEEERQPITYYKRTE